ncbi:MAG: GntR family transcriptional regulator [Acidimicrobiaceae bacterium]|nr:GntR family transcriptional regulator [Acidimicrobiaceae bacterium]
MSQPAVSVDGAGRPKYLQLRDLLLEVVRELPPGAMVPTERELCERFAVSRSTVRHALDRLEAEQRIYRRQGSGTFVAEPKIEQPLELTSHTEYMRARGLRPGSKLIDVSRTTADSEVSTMLGLPENGEALRIERVRLADGEPLALETLFLDADRFDGIALAFDENQSLYQLLRSRYGVELATAEETIEAVLADERESELLGTAPGVPLLRLSRQSRDAEGRPVEFVRSLYRADRFRFRTRLERSALVPPPSRAAQLRAGTPEDAGGLAAVFVAAWRQAYPGIVPDAVLDGLDEEEIADWLRTLVASPGATTTVAESASGVLVGFARYGEDPEDHRRGHLFSLYVSPGAASRGVGRLLLTEALQDFRERRLEPVTLWVFEANERAKRLYQAFGFVEDGARRTEPEYGSEEVRLCRSARTLT